MEKFYSSKTLLKLADGGMHPPYPPLDPPVVMMFHKNAFRTPQIRLRQKGRACTPVPFSATTEERGKL